VRPPSPTRTVWVVPALDEGRGALAAPLEEGVAGAEAVADGDGAADDALPAGGAAVTALDLNVAN